MSSTPRIDDHFRSQIPPLSADERAQLEANLVADGCRDPLTVWAETDILLDGHNRYEICTRLGIPFAVTRISLASREDAADWIDRNQLGRRNLTPDQLSLLRGRRYNRAKRQDGGHGDQRSAPQNEGPKVQTPHTAERLAGEHGVSRATIERDGQFAAAVDTLKPTIPDIEQRVLAGDVPSKQVVVEAAREPELAEMLRVARGDKEILDAAKEIREARTQERRVERTERLSEIASREVHELTGEFDVLVVDPPWPMQKVERDCRPNQDADLDYPTMTEAEIAALDLHAAPDCHLWLWTTHRFMPMALRVLDAWGFRYVCTFVWHKPGGFQPVGLPQYNCEFAIYAKRGNPPFADTKAFSVCFNAPRGRHSEKPEEFYELVRRVTVGRRADLFSRRPIDGFDAWGNEAA